MPTDPPRGEPHADTTIRTLWFGMRCASTLAAVRAAMAAASADLEVIGVVVPAGPRLRASGWLHHARRPAFDREVGVPVVEIAPAGDRGSWDAARAAVIALVEATGATLGVGACFPWKVPAEVRSVFPLGVVNIHPSLLPALRGADPVGVALRLGLRETGVTIHRMDDGWDTGPILASRALPIAPGRDAAALEAELFRLGGAMLGATLAGWRAGAIVPAPQGHGAGTWPDPCIPDG